MILRVLCLLVILFCLFGSFAHADLAEYKPLLVSVELRKVLVSSVEGDFIVFRECDLKVDEQTALLSLDAGSCGRISQAGILNTPEQTQRFDEAFPRVFNTTMQEQINKGTRYAIYGGLGGAAVGAVGGAVGTVLTQLADAFVSLLMYRPSNISMGRNVAGMAVLVGVSTAAAIYSYYWVNNADNAKIEDSFLRQGVLINVLRAKMESLRLKTSESVLQELATEGYESFRRALILTLDELTTA